MVSTATRQSPDPLTDPVVNSRGELERARSPLDSFGCADELVAWCRERLAPFKVPRRWIFVEGLPRTEGGKLRRRELR